VLKNETSFYLTWWGVQRVADFDYSAMVHDPALHVTEYMNMESISNNITEVQASTAYCQMLPTQYTLNSCLTPAVIVANDDDDSSMTVNTVDIVGLSIGAVMVLIFTFLCGYHIATRQHIKNSSSSELKKPLRESELGNSYLN